MSDQDEALARRWMASKHWGGYCQGMRDRFGNVCLGVSLTTLSGVMWWSHADSEMHIAPRMPGELDLDHPGTRAFLLEDVRRAWGEYCSVTLYGDGSVSVDVPGTPSGTEAICFDSLIAALEAAPE